MRRVLVALAVLGLTLGVGAPRADAHNPNGYSLWACGASRPSQYHIVTHAHPEVLTSRWLWSWCEASVFGQTCQWGVYLYSDGTVSRSTAYDC